MSEKDLIALVTKPIEDITLDYKAFIARRENANYVEYTAYLVVIAPYQYGEAIMKRLAQIELASLTFVSSDVQMDENRGVDRLVFRRELRFDGKVDNAQV
ncbi:MAG: hypothetical protein LBQ52_09810 [Helicobacteraceae bacterium]|jgi:hypothetical protein|nr:hypothetical protein [Helicobacteraceae bacterium]